MDFWRRAWHDLRLCCDLLLPPACLLCDQRLPVGAPAAEFCPACHAGLPAPAPARCPVCAVAHRALTPTLHQCEGCLRAPPPFTPVHAVGPYAGPLQEAIQRFKHRGQSSLERPLGILLGNAVLRAGGPRADLVVPVPLHRNRLRARGYNQALQLARRVGGRLEVPVAPTLLRRARDTAAQQGLNAVARKSNLRGAFVVTTSLAGERLLLIDDVLTTGATARECARTLQAAGAGAVDVAVLGRA